MCVCMCMNVCAYLCLEEQLGRQWRADTTLGMLNTEKNIPLKNDCVNVQRTKRNCVEVKIKDFNVLDNPLFVASNWIVRDETDAKESYNCPCLLDTEY